MGQTYMSYIFTIGDLDVGLYHVSYNQDLK